MCPVFHSAMMRASDSAFTHFLRCCDSLDIGGQRKRQPFAQSHEEQLGLALDLNWFDADSLKGIDEEIAEIFSQSRTIDEARSNAISAEVVKRAETVAKRKHQSVFWKNS